MSNLQRFTIRACVMAACAGWLATQDLRAQPHEHSHAGGGAEPADHDHSGEVLAYRLPQGTTMQFDDPRVAAQHLDAVKKLGCEAQQQPVGGRTGVSYRCPEWRTMTVATHELSEQWEGWLKGAGFDCFHGHVAAEMLKGPEVINLRLADWKRLHDENLPPGQVQQIRLRLVAVGCEVQEDKHDGHADVLYRCPVWSEIHLPNHEAAEQWLAFLKAQGFETRHED